jgi:hypothetical protein
LDVFDDRQVQELDLQQTLREVISTKDHTIIQGLPIIQVYTKEKADAELEKIGNGRFRLR